MASIDVDTAALHAAAGSIGDIADSFAIAHAPAVRTSGAQSTTAAVKAVHGAAFSAECTMATRLRETASAMAEGGIAFATTERASTSRLVGLPSDHG